MPTPEELLAQSLAKGRTANRIDGQKNSYRKDNPSEYDKVMAYLDGAARPEVVSDMGLHLVLEEDARRALTDSVEPIPPPTGIKLRDRPPGWPDYTGFTRITHDGRGYYRLDDARDYLFTNGLGSFSYPEGVYLEGGRRVVVIGGHITSTGSDRALGVGLSLRGYTDAAHHYIEGVRIAPTKGGGTWDRTLNDGIATRGAKGKITIQNCLVGPVAIKEGFSDAQAHADVLQVQAGPWEGELRVHRLTGLTDYTGVMESEILVRKQSWHQVNLRGVDVDPGEKAWTTFYGTNAVTVSGLSLTEFYAEGFGAGAAPASLNNIILRGAPPGGDFVTEEQVKIPYTSPGYA